MKAEMANFKSLKSVISILFAYLALIPGISQEKAPEALGPAEWKLTTAATQPALLQVSPSVTRMNTTTLADNRKVAVFRKKNPGTEIIAERAFEPGTGVFTTTGKPLFPVKVMPASPLLYRENHEYNIQYTDQQHGFAASNSVSVAEDQSHNIWIATNIGLVKYDGYHYVVYNQKSGLPNAQIVKLLNDRFNRLWVATEKGVFYIRHDSLFTLQSSNFYFPELRCRNITEDHYNGRLWISTWDKGAIAITGKELKLYDKAHGLPNNTVFTVDTDKDGNTFIVSSESGITVLQKNRVIRMFHRARNSTGNIFLSIAFTEEGTWIGGYRSGLIRIGPKDTIEYALSGSYTERIYDILKARQGIWVSIYGKGLYYLGKKQQFLINAQNGMQNDGSYFLFEDSFSNIWIADYIKGLSRLNENSFYYKSYPGKLIECITHTETVSADEAWLFTDRVGLMHRTSNLTTRYSFNEPDGTATLNIPFSGQVMPGGTVWMGSYGLGIVKGEGAVFTNYYFTGQDPQKNIVHSVQRGKEDQLWFATEINGLIRYDGKQFWHYTRNSGLLQDETGRLLHDDAGNIYCNYTNGIQQYTPTAIRTLFINGKSYAEKINACYINETGAMLLATAENGLILISKGQAYRFSKEQGLLSDKILTIKAASDGKIWITSDKGIERFLLRGERITEHRLFDRAYGSYVSDHETAVSDPDGTIYWPGNNPVRNKQLVYDTAFEKISQPPPVFSFDSIRINSQKEPHHGSLSFLPDKKIEIFFGLKYWGRENNLTLAYLIVNKNGDSSFHPIESSGKILLSEMLPGSYSVYLTARDNNTIYRSEPVRMQVTPFWYNDWPFRLSVAALVFMCIVLYFRQKGKQQLHINQLLEKKVKDQTIQLMKEKDELLLSYQTIERQNNERGVLLQEINHRVKNNLQFMIAILEMQLNSELPESARMALRTASGRMNAMAMVHAMLYESDNLDRIPIRKYVHELTGYLKNMAADTGSEVVFNVNIADITIPMKSAISMGMIIAELVSNSFKHAFTGITDPEISIQIQRGAEPGQYMLRYADNGTGMTGDAIRKKGIGNRLISIFSRELSGDYSVESHQQFIFTLLFFPDKKDETDE
jgi:two-component sensor histidine kinase/ligand-binding sensor domain-containing protein